MPECIISVANELILFDQPLKRLGNEFLAVFHIPEQLVPKNKISSVDRNIRILYVVHPFYKISIPHRYNMKAEGRLDAQKAAHFFALNEVINHIWQVQVGERIGIVRQENFFAFKVGFNDFQSLPDIGPKTCVNEVYGPVRDVAVIKDVLFPAVAYLEIIGNVFVIIQKIIFDHIRLVTQA